MMPILPHLSNECIESIKTENDELSWPIYDEKQIKEDADKESINNNFIKNIFVLK